ncbi:MAG: 3-deoxy-D-manno-octulosonic acid transferase [Pseudomonadota bacterium]
MTSPGRAPPLIRIYSTLADLAAPLTYRKVTAKLSGLGTATERLPERRGVATRARPDTALLWCHAASVGESLSVLPLIQSLSKSAPGLSFLITSGTQTSAEILSRRLPPRTQHQFAPLDSRGYLRRFLDHWRPNAAVFVESELWPNMLRETRARGAKMALVNARISDRSVNNWKRFQHSAEHLLRHFDMIHCQDDRTAAHLHDLGLAHAERGVNLKSLAGPLPYDSAVLTKLRKITGARPLWLAASTHPGEDEIALDVHCKILRAYPDALLILVPRHPERAGAIKALIEDADQSVAQRSTGDLPGPEHTAYLADTLGEMGLWYNLSPVTLLCGSFTDVGGHNPFEPAQAGSFVLHGPNYANFELAYRDLDAAGAGRNLSTASQIADALKEMFGSRDITRRQQEAARRFASQNTDGLESLSASLFKALQLR